jgi:hypothetical protein
MSSTSPAPSSLGDPLVAVFVVISLSLAALFVAGVWHAWRRTGASRAHARRATLLAAAGTAIWMGATDAAARSGIFRRWDVVPPPWGLLVLSIVGIGIVVAFGPVGRRLLVLPLWVLVAAQAFRVPLELAMHSAYERGIMPIQMSYSGRNFDIVTGLSAIVVAVLLVTSWAGRRIALIWNLLGMALLVNVVTVAILSTPLFAYFGDQRLNTWVTYPVFVWLPCVMVLAALIGHLLIFRRLAIISRPRDRFGVEDRQTADRREGR